MTFHFNKESPFVLRAIVNAVRGKSSTRLTKPDWPIPDFANSWTGSSKVQGTQTPFAKSVRLEVDVDKQD